MASKLLIRANDVTSTDSDLSNAGQRDDDEYTELLIDNLERAGVDNCSIR